MIKKTSSIQLYLWGAGTGKSTFINSLADCVKIAPTNLQCKIINGKTIYNLTKSAIGKLSSNKLIFQHSLIIVDECFMYSASEMKVIIECLPATFHLILFGDPFQQDFIPSSDSSTFFYESLPFSPQVFYSTKNFRISDPKLLALLNDYKLTGKSVDTRTDFQQIILENLIDMVLEQNAIVLCGSHKRRRWFSTKIVNRSHSKFFAADG